MYTWCSKYIMEKWPLGMQHMSFATRTSGATKLHSAQRSILPCQHCKWGCMTWQNADRSLCWGLQPSAIKASFQASSLVCLRTSSIKAIAKMRQSCLGIAAVPNRDLLGLKSCMVLRIGSETFIVEPQSPNHQSPSLSTKKSSACKNYNCSATGVFDTMQKEALPGCDATKGTCTNPTLTSMWTKPSAYTCSMAQDCYKQSCNESRSAQQYWQHLHVGR